MAKRTGKTRMPMGVSATADLAPALVVGIGSAGGLEPISALLSQLKPGCGFAIILIQHPGRGGEVLLATLGQQRTRLKVMEAADGTLLEPDHVYVVPSRGLLSLINGRFSVRDMMQCQGLRMPIDHFLCTLAADQGRRSVGIILSGTGADGTGGLAEIRAVGGVTIAQDPKTAQFPDMPSNAIAAGHADTVLRPEKMAPFLSERLNELTRLTAEREEEAGLDAVLLAVRTSTGHDFNCYKRGTLERRTRRRMALHRLDGYDDYARMIRTNNEEAAALRKDLLIGVTDFFRQVEAWRVLEEKVLSSLIQKAQPQSTLRIWVPACSLGKEAYSVAMLMVECIERSRKKLALQVFATDADASAVEIARVGVYAEEELKGLSQERLERFCVRKSGRYEFKKQLRSVIVFAPQDLLADPPFSKLDLVTCRNLLIYLDPTVQRKIIQLFHFTLRDGAYIFLGSAETICGQDNLFEPISQKWRIYRKLGVSRPVGLDLPLRPQLKSVVAVPPAVPRSRLTLPALTHQAIAERYGPAAAVVNREGALLYTHGNVRDFLELPLGETTGLLVAAAREGLRNRLAGALVQAAAENKKITVRARARKENKSLPVKITVSPLRRPREADGLLLVIFEAIPLPKAPPPAAEGEPFFSNHRQLEDELKITREELSSTIDQLERSNEHLKASNEEVTAANEELQSTNEELETSKEELQSLNEELNAVNQRLQEKVVELEQASNDVSNLLTSGGVATIFLDRDLKVRRFTRAVTKLLSLVETDVGRPIADIHHKFHDDSLLTDARAVLANLTPAAGEVQAEDGSWHSRRILPYRTQDDRIDGVVITFNDVTDLKELADALRASEASVRQSEERFRLLVDGVKDYAIFMLDVEGRVVSWNNGAQRIKGWTAEEIIGQSLDRFYTTEAVAEGLPRAQLQRAATQGNSEDEGWRMRKDGTRFWASVTITALRDDRGRLRGFSKITRDTTEHKQIDQALRAARDKANWLARFPEENPNPVLRASVDGRVLYRNPPAGRLPGWACEAGDSLPQPLLSLIGEAMGRGLPMELDTELGERFYTVSVTPFVAESYANIYGRDVTEHKRAEEALRKSELQNRFLGDLLERSDQPFGVGYPDGTLGVVNTAFERLTGYSRDELRSMDWDRVLTPPKWRDLEHSKLEELQSTGKPVRYEKEYIRKDGTLVPIELLVHLEKDEQGRPMHYYSFLTDLTERKQAEGAGERLARQRQLALDAAHLGWWLYDPVTKIATYDARYREIFGISGTEQPNEEILRLLHSEDLTRVWAAVQAALDPENPQPYSVEFRINRPDGSARWIEAHGTATFEGTGSARRAISFVGTVADITERKADEESMRQSERRERERAEELAVLFEAVPMPLFIARDPECLHLAGNSRANEILRIPHGDELSLSAPPEVRPRHFRPLRDGRELRFDELPAQRAARGDQVKDFEFTLAFDDGVIRHVLGYGTPLLDDQGRPRGSVAVLVDITARKQAEVVLQNTLQRFYQVLSNMSLGVLLVTDEGRVEFVNQTFCDRFGLRVAPSDLVGLDSREMIEMVKVRYLDPDEAVARIREILNQGQPVKNEELAMQGGQTSLRDFVPLRVGGKSYGRLWLHVDISERKMAEVALRKQEEQLRLFVENAPAAIAMFDTEMRYVAASNRWLLDYRLPGEELRGRCHYDVFPDIPERWKQIHSRCLAGAVERAEEDPYRRADGTVQWLRWEVRPWRDGSGAIGGIIIFSEDVTARKQAQTVMERYQLITQYARDPLLLVGVDGQIVEANQAAADLYGYCREHLLGLKLADLRRHDDPKLIHRQMEQALTNGILFEAVHFRADGTSVPVEVSSRGVVVEGRQMLLSVIRDITARKQAEERLRLSTEELARSNQDLAQFAQVASHDLQEPLRMVTGFLTLLQERYGPQLDDRAREYISFSVDGAARMSQLITDLLAYSRVSHQEREPRSIDSNEALAGATANLQGLILEAGATVTHDDLPIVVGDASQLTQLFQNLISNAIKFRGKDRPCMVHVSAQRREDQWRFSFRDNGIGIPEEAFDRVFVIFQRLHTRGEYSGTGIGLAICKKIVARHGGRIWVESKVGEGTIFYFTLPQE